MMEGRGCRGRGPETCNAPMRNAQVCARLTLKQSRWDKLLYASPRPQRWQYVLCVRTAFTRTGLRPTRLHRSGEAARAIRELVSHLLGPDFDYSCVRVDIRWCSVSASSNCPPGRSATRHLPGPLAHRRRIVLQTWSLCRVLLKIRRGVAMREYNASSCRRRP